MKIAKLAGSTRASAAILCICSSAKSAASFFSSGVIMATAFFSCSNSSVLGAASIASSLLPSMSWNWLLISLPYLLPENRANFFRYCSIEIFSFIAVLFFLFYFCHRGLREYKYIFYFKLLLCVLCGYTHLVFFLFVLFNGHPISMQAVTALDWRPILQVAGFCLCD